MTLLGRYIISEILKNMGFVLAATVFIYLAVDFFERIDNFLEAGVPVSRAFVYFFFKSPQIISQIFPVAMLISVLIALALMVKNNEIIALKSAGIGIRTLLPPVLFLGCAASIVLFLFSEFVMPSFTQKANRIWLHEVRKKPLMKTRQKNIWRRDGSRITHIRYFKHIRPRYFTIEKNEIYGLTQYEFDPDFALIRRLDAKFAEYVNSTWKLYDAILQTRKVNDAEFAIEIKKETAFHLGFLPEDLTRVVKTAEELSFMELYETIETIESEGYRADKIRVDLWAKTAFPGACFVVTMLAAGIGFLVQKRDALIINIVSGIGIAFLYWISLSFFMSLGYGERLNPFVSAWLANLVFILPSFFMIFRAE